MSLKKHRCPSCRAKLVLCPYCGNLTLAQGRFCSHCGASLNATRQPARSLRLQRETALVRYPCSLHRDEVQWLTDEAAKQGLPRNDFLANLVEEADGVVVMLDGLPSSPRGTMQTVVLYIFKPDIAEWWEEVEESGASRNATVRSLLWEHIESSAQSEEDEGKE